MDHLELPKHTPQRTRGRSTARKAIDEALASSLASPFAFNDTLAINLWPSTTPLRRQPEYLLSPSPVKRDLFTQLLAHDNHAATPAKAEYIIEENSSSEDISISQSEGINSQKSDVSDVQNDDSSDENDIRKRKRKSTAQIKILKEHLNGEMNWTKQKICKMAEVTGLSQSQVYKWCWDQKKKQNRHGDENNHEKSKYIRKSLHFRQPFHELTRFNFPRVHEKEKLQQKDRVQDENQAQTKIKAIVALQVEKSTEKKLKKRLIFN